MLEAQGAKEAAILRAEAEMKVLELQAEGEKKAFVLRGEGEAARLSSLDTATINPRTLAVLQLRALQDIAAAPGSKVVVPYEAASLMGSAEVLLSTLRQGSAALSDNADSPNGSEVSSLTESTARHPPVEPPPHEDAQSHWSSSFSRQAQNTVVHIRSAAPSTRHEPAMAGPTMSCCIAS